VTTFAVPGASATVAAGIDDRGQVAGTYFDAGTTLGDDRGQVVGTWDDRFDTDANEPGSRHGFVWDRGRVTRLDVPGSLFTGALGINNRGQLTGSYDDADGGHHGFVLQRGRVTTIDAPGWILTDAWGINDLGEIVIPELGTGLGPVTR
jgi:uncharacterized membrane protein